MNAIRYGMSMLAVCVFTVGSLMTAGAVEAQDGKTAPQAKTAKETTVESATEPYDIRTTKYLTGDWGGVRTDLEEEGVNFSILLGTMTQFNFRGGLNTHNAHETGGKAFYNLELDFEKMAGLHGATFFGRCIQTWNSGIGADVGSLTPPYWSAGSGGDQAWTLDKWWYRQRLLDNRIELRLGKIRRSFTQDLVGLLQLAVFAF